ncbi:MAG: 30S ribosomal protein S12 methylthiotransferase RimO [Bdellovibrionaceae bacterium]|nr:30S ribosomal protein S12 methylthiotransferase RimO [Pseudobdellovibrionaceae bacterium]
MKTKSVYFVSLGCPKNLVDSQVMLGLLEKEKYSISQSPDRANVIIVNTCSFIQASKEESIETILEMADFKQTGVCELLVVSGCLPQRYSSELKKEMPEIDLLIGTGQYHRITELLGKHQKAIEQGDPLPERAYVDQPAFIHTESDPRMHTGKKASAFLKISEGCNRRCAFCIIPTLRGKVRSRSIHSLVEEAKGMAKNGVKELNLVAQDLTHYGIENDYQENLERLLPELVKIDGIEWIRLHYAYPDRFSSELVDLIAKEKKIVNYIDMPIQHTSNAVLKKMGRALTKERLFNLVSELREKIPEVVFRTSIIVGFPGETEQDFLELCEDLRNLNLDHVGVFRYSKEEGTRAFDMDNQVPAAEARKRSQKLIQILQDQRWEKQNSYLGKEFPALIEGVSSESDLLLQGRIPTQAQEIDGYVLINDLGDHETVDPGDLVMVRVTEAHPDFLVASLV